MEKEYAKDYSIPFHSDVLFKYMLIGDDVGSVLLRSRTTEEIYGLKAHETKILNPESLPEAFSDKRAVLDVVLEDEAGHFYDLEMQVSGYTQKEQLRSQQYGYRLVGRQLKQGGEYIELKPLYQIIFMNDKPRDGGRMICHYKVKDEDSQEEPNGTLNRATVFLPMIKQCVKEVGGMENLTEFEAFYYVLAYNPDDATPNMKRRMVNVVTEKYNEMREDGSLFSWAESVEFVERAVQANLKERTAEAEKLGLEKGLRKGLEKGLVKGKRTMLKTLSIHKHGIDADWVDTLSEQQLDDVVVQILDCATYNVLKEETEKNELEQKWENVEFH